MRSCYSLPWLCVLLPYQQSAYGCRWSLEATAEADRRDGSPQVVSRALGAQARRHTSPVEALQQLLGDGADADGALALKDVNDLLQLLWERKQVLEQQQAEANLELLLHFLQHSRWVPCVPHFGVQPLSSCLAFHQISQCCGATALACAALRIDACTFYSLWFWSNIRSHADAGCVVCPGSAMHFPWGLTSIGTLLTLLTHPSAEQEGQGAEAEAAAVGAADAGGRHQRCCGSQGARVTAGRRGPHHSGSGRRGARQRRLPCRAGGPAGAAAAVRAAPHTAQRGRGGEWRSSARVATVWCVAFPLNRLLGSWPGNWRLIVLAQGA